MVPHPFIYEINTWVWLDELSEREGISIDLGSVPGSEWDAIAALGFDVVWLMGVWERSPAGIAIALENAACWRASGAPCPTSVPRMSSARRTASATTRSTPTSADRRGSPPRGRRSPSAASGCSSTSCRTTSRPTTRGRETHPEYFVRGSDDDLARDPASFVRVGDGVLANGRDPYFAAVARRRAAERVLARPACSRDRDAELDRRAVRRRALRHGDADDERHVRAHLG